MFLDAILWLAWGASPWRDLPPELGHWRTVHSRFRRWTIEGVWESLIKAFSTDPDFEYVLVDATICKTHADATSQNPSRDNASHYPARQLGGLEAAGIGRSKGGLSTKLHAAVDALGLPIRIVVTPGQWGDSPIDWMLYKERHLAECFFNKIKRFRRIALRCEKTVSSFKAFVDLACTMAWIG